MKTALNTETMRAAIEKFEELDGYHCPDDRRLDVENWGTGGIKQ